MTWYNTCPTWSCTCTDGTFRNDAEVFYIDFFGALREKRAASDVSTVFCAAERAVVQEVTPTVADLPVERGYIILIDRTKRGKRSMGIEIGKVQTLGLRDWEGGGLRVKQVKQGLVRQWNLSNPDVQVCENDVIVEVNSERGNCEHLLQKMTDEPVLRLRLVRPSDFLADDEPEAEPA